MEIFIVTTGLIYVQVFVHNNDTFSAYIFEDC